MNECELVIDSKMQKEKAFSEIITINSITLMILIEIFRDISLTESRNAYSSVEADKRISIHNLLKLGWEIGAAKKETLILQNYCDTQGHGANDCCLF